MQDTEEGSSRTEGYSIGQTMGYNKADAKTEKKWVSQQTTLIGTDAVDVKADKVSVEGAVIANVDENGVDQGNLNIETNELVVKDIKDKDYQYGESYGIAISGPGTRTDGKETGAPKGTGESGGGSTTLNFANNGQDNEQINRGTIGKGNINAKTQIIYKTDGDSVEGLNRDVAKAQQTTKQKKLGGYDIQNLSIQNDMVTNTGEWVKDSFDTLAGLPGNTFQAGENVAKAGTNLAAATVENLTGNGDDGVVTDYQGTIRNQELGLQVKINETLIESLENMANDSESMANAEQALEDLANQAVRANGITDGDVKVVVYNKNDGNMGGHKNGTIYLNMNYQDGSNETLMEVMGDELSHYVDYKNGRPNSNVDSRRQDISTDYGDNAGDQTKGYVGNEQVDATAFQESMKNLDFTEANQEVAATEGMENRTTVYLRKLDLPDSLNKVGGHLFGKVTERENNQPDYHFSLEGNMKGGEPKLNTKKVIDNDNAAFTNGGIIDQQVIAPAKGMSQTEFDELVIKNSRKYDTKAPQNQYPIGGVIGGPDARNSNTYVDNVVEESGGKTKEFGDINAPRQNSGEIQEGLIKKTVDTKYGAKILWDKWTNGGKSTEALKAQRNQEKTEALRKDRGFKD